jgi:hypothetical protein
MGFSAVEPDVSELLPIDFALLVAGHPSILAQCGRVTKAPGINDKTHSSSRPE